MADTLPALKRELWALVSKYVRSSRATTGGHVRCYTCGTWDRWQDMDAGHLHKRWRLSTCFDLRNIRPQCRICNRHKDGMEAAFRSQLLDEIGPREVEALDQKSREDVEYDRDWYQKQIKSYKQKIKELGEIDGNF